MTRAGDEMSPEQDANDHLADWISPYYFPPPTELRRRVLVLGSTGSIGTQALEVIAANPDRFELVGLAAGGGHPDLLAQQRARTGVTNVAVADERAAQRSATSPTAGPMRRPG